MTVKIHEEEWPNSYKQAELNGKNWVKRLESIRGDTDVMIRSIYGRNPKLLQW